uniref:uncharacterized protein LOC114598028 n=1 Tax=Podarcis muralis TaxID=64176 RepID=UPI00109FBDE3|nr:uncharacterized protein LOC114598028 [Podarcis muralis]
MSEERVVSCADAIEEDANAAGEEHPSRCFQASALCCCIPRRRLYLPGRRPKDRKKKNEKKNYPEDLSCDVTIFEQRDQNMGQDYWKMTPAGDLGVQTEAIKPALAVCTQPYDRKIQDPHIPMPLSDIFLEEKQGECDEKTSANTFQTPQQKEGSDNMSVLSLEKVKKKVVGAKLEGDPSEEGKEYLIMAAEESRQHRKSELLSAVLQEVTDEKEQQKERGHTGIILEGLPCKKDQKRSHQDVPFQELQQTRELEPNSTLTASENKTQEEQNTSIDSKGTTSLQELFNQPAVPCNEKQQVGRQQQHGMGITHNMEKPVFWSQINPVSKGDVHKEEQAYKANQEVQQPVEQKYPDILSTMCGNDEQEQPEVQQLLDFVRETSSNEINLFDQEDQLPILPKAMSFPLEDTTCEKEQEDTQAFRSSTLESFLSMSEDHQYVPHQMDLQAVAKENITTLPLGVACTMDLQKLAYINSLPQDVVPHVAKQKHSDAQQLLLLEQISTHHDEKEMQEGLDYAHSGCKGTAYTEEQEKQKLNASEHTPTLPDNLSYEKEQQRKLDCGDSGSEGTYDKEDQDHQGTLYLEVQRPLGLAKLSSLPLSGTSEELCVRKDNLYTGILEIPSLNEEQEAEDDESKVHMLASCKDNATAQEQEEQPLPMLPQAGCNTEGEQLETWHIQKTTSIPYEEQQEREQLNLGMTCEEHQKKGKWGLSSTTFPSTTKEDEGHM